MIPIPALAWVGIGGIVAFGALYFIDANRIAERDVTISNMKTAAATLESERDKAARLLTDSNAAWSIKLQKQSADAQHEHDIEHNQLQSFLDAARAETAKANGKLGAAAVESGRLRDQLAAYANAGNGAAGDDTLTAARDRAAALGDVLTDVLSTAAGLATAAEDHASGVRALLSAWPSSCVAPGVGAVNISGQVSRTDLYSVFHHSNSLWGGDGATGGQLGTPQ